MKKIILALTLIALLAVGLGMTSCQSCTRTLGGTTTIKLEPGEKLVECTWKGNSIWYLVEPMDVLYVPKTKTFKESSNTGMLDGQVIFIETR